MHSLLLRASAATRGRGATRRRQSEDVESSLLLTLNDDNDTKATMEEQRVDVQLEPMLPRDDDIAHTIIGVSGMTCSSCVHNIEKNMRSMKGMLKMPRAISRLS